jgi:hypothetical protein
LPAVVDRATFQAELDRLRVREKAHTREGDAIAAAGNRPSSPDGQYRHALPRQHRATASEHYMLGEQDWRTPVSL